MRMVCRKLSAAVQIRSAFRSACVRWGRVLLVGAAVGGTLATVGCGDESVAPQPAPPAKDLYWELAVNHEAVLLSTTAPYNTLQLAAVPRNAYHDPLLNAPAPVFESTDPENLTVTPDGQMVALHAINQPVVVRAALTIGNVKRVVEIKVRAIDTTQPIMLGAFSLQPASPAESTKVAMRGELGFPGMVPVHATDVNGAPMPIYGRDPDGIVPVAFKSEDMTTLAVDSATGVTGGITVGATRVVGSTTVFGVHKADTVAYRVGYPLYGAADLTFVDLFDLSGGTSTTSYRLTGPDILLGTGGVVRWYMPLNFAQADTAFVEFADADVPKIGSAVSALQILTAGASPARVNQVANLFCGLFGGGCAPEFEETGNVPLVSNDLARFIASRSFPVPGVYNYTIRFAGNRYAPLQGRITVGGAETLP